MRTRTAGDPLVRLFLGRLLESELLPPGLPQLQVVIWAIALLAAPGYLLSMVFAAKYGRLPAARVPDAILADDLFFVTVNMMALGIVGLVLWESVFPDRRDVRILGVLPLPDRRHVEARLAALAIVALLFAAGANLPTAVAYGLTLWVQAHAAGPLRGIAGQLTASVLAGLFAFFLVIVCQGVMLNVAGRRLARRLGLILQAALVVLLLQTLVFVPYLGARVAEGFAAGGNRWTAWLPSAWFLALLDWLVGAPRPVPAGPVVTALVATVASAGAAGVLLAASYRRLVRLALEAPAETSGARHFAGRLAAGVAPLATSDPIGRASAGFVLRTFVRSPTHQTLLASYAGLALALSAGGVIPAVSRAGWHGLDRPSIALLSAPLAVLFVLLCGSRVLLGIPAELKAAIAFRIHAPENALDGVVAGVRTALVLAVIAPVSCLALATGVWLWGAFAGVAHALFVAAAGLALLDGLLLGLRWIPFTRPYRPSPRARMSWPLYALAFSVYAYSLAGLELVLLRRPLALVCCLGLAAASSAALAWLRHRELRSPPWLSFDDADPGELFRGFGLSEGLAAEAGAAPGPVRCVRLEKADKEAGRM